MHLAGMPPISTATRRIAAIDVGTNSLRLIVAEASPDGTYRVLDDEKATTRLGRGLAETGRLADAAMEESVQAIARMKGISEGYGVSVLRIIGTCAVREASNGPDFREMVLHRTGLTLVPITGEEEARLAYLSAAAAFDLREVSTAVVDIGGGSTEIVLCQGGVVEHLYTFPLGAVRQTEQFPGCEQPGNEEAYNALRDAVRDQVKDLLEKPPFTPQFIIGTGGTFTTLAAVSMHRGAGGASDGMLPFAVRGYEMQRSEIKHTLEWLRQVPIKARARIPGLAPDRAEIIIAGTVIAEAFLKRLGANAIKVHDRGIRDGLLLTMIAELYPRASDHAAEPLDRMRSARHFASNCRYEEQHSNHVANLAVEIFDQLVQQRPEALGSAGGAQGRDLLLAAGVLHDVGYFINYSKHHKHSYHLIVHSDLAGFTHRELEIIANVARYHRRSEPKTRHPNFAKLPDADRRIVRALSAILRVADGMDRTHTQSVRKVRLTIHGGEALFTADAEQEPAVDLWGAERKSELFARQFGLKPRFQWVGSFANAGGGDAADPGMPGGSGALAQQ